MVFKKTLNFTAKEAKQPFSLLIFTQPTETGPYRLYHDLFPVAWRVINFGDSAAEDSIDFIMNLKAFVTKKTQGNLVKAETSKEVSEGQSVSVVMAGGGVDAPTFKEPTGVVTPGATIHVENETGSFQGLGLMVNGTPAVLFPTVGNQNVVEIKMTPKIYMVVNQSYKETEILKAAVVSDNLICVDLGTFLKDSVDIAVGQDDGGAWKITAN